LFSIIKQHQADWEVPPLSPSRSNLPLAVLAVGRLGPVHWGPWEKL
jgi:hypothetical protein